ncbi:InlB B-repeat-containing protein [Aurantimicrobium sp. MWH-Uga1]|uniref:InlB B-repeat-containing protein n=1 Tax=Aurantimicrobium sp. MWH-Uga1 TaxID=2079575 RepID=UPI000DEDFA30|nr:InlB B-repeat-containing protein [Aurantimicrobium sp. MWH-Uga1]AXE54037.1 hypothetical protein AURUGA1_00328 [Aurantimicrobium sp. MWH-Uga1]
MQKFSLKALSAAFLTLGLVVAGLAAPAHAAAGITMITNPVPTFDASTASPAFEVKIDNGGTAFVDDGSPSAGQITIEVRGTGSATGMWSLPSGCATSFTAFASSNCGILSITGTGIGTPVVKKDISQLVIKGLGTATSINIQFAASAYQVAASGGTYNFKAITGPGFMPVEYILPITVNSAPPPATYTVTFDSNGGTGTMSNQTNGGFGPLNNNTFVKSGTTFRGWSTTCNGSLVYANRAMYNFSANATLYAVWADGSNACGGGGGAPSSASVNLTLNATTGQLVAGSTVAIAASGLQSTAAYSLVVQSTPQTIGSGNATAGAVNTSVTLPTGLEAGWHTLTFSSTAADGSAVTSVTYFKVSASGTLLATSSTIPAELAQTGFDAAPYLFGGLALALVGGALMLIARRKQSN